MTSEVSVAAIDVQGRSGAFIGCLGRSSVRGRTQLQQAARCSLAHRHAIWGNQLCIQLHSSARCSSTLGVQSPSRERNWELTSLGTLSCLDCTAPKQTSRARPAQDYNRVMLAQVMGRNGFEKPGWHCIVLSAAVI